MGQYRAKHITKVPTRQVTQNRQQLADRFLAENGWSDATRSLLAGDASNRSYDRVKHSDGRIAVLMNAPLEKGEQPEVFVGITDILRGFGYSAPEILAHDLTNGFLLIEDLGDALFAKICNADPTMETPCYQAAVDVLVDLYQHHAPDGLSPYDQPTYDREAALVTQWYMPAAGVAVSADLEIEYLSLIRSACNLLSKDKTVLVMRDYHAENLIWLPTREGVKRVGLLDYQDALAGHPAYDLVSLLEDARRDTGAAMQTEMKARYADATGQDFEEFSLAYDILGAQRNLKIVGIFARLCCRDGKAAYLDLIPRVWAHLQRDLQNPALSDLRAWVNQNVPAPSAATLAKIRAYNA